MYKQYGKKMVGNDAVKNQEQGFSISISSSGYTVATGGPATLNNLLGASWIFQKEERKYM